MEREVRQLSINWELTEEEKTLMSILNSRLGRENAICVKELSRLTGLKDVEIRSIVRHLILEHSALIASSPSKPAGFFKPISAEEVAAATKSLRHRGISILVRASRLQKISLEEIFHQARFEFNESGN